MGEFICLAPLVLGQPVCAVSYHGYRAETKILGSFEMLAQFHGDTSSNNLPSIIRRVLASSIEVGTLDFTNFSWDATNPTLTWAAPTKISYEIRLRALERLEQVMQAFRGLADTSSQIRVAFTRAMLYYGILVQNITAIYGPVNFQEMLLVSEPADMGTVAPEQKPVPIVTIVAGFLGFTIGLPILACAIHAAANRLLVHHQACEQLLPRPASACSTTRPRWYDAASGEKE